MPATPLKKSLRSAIPWLVPIGVAGGAIITGSGSSLMDCLIASEISLKTPSAVSTTPLTSVTPSCTNSFACFKSSAVNTGADGADGIVAETFAKRPCNSGSLPNGSM